MKKPSALWTGSIGVCILLYIAFSAFAWCLAEPPTEHPGILPLSTGCVEVPGASRDKTVHSTIEWEGREYGSSEATTVLMKVITNPVTDSTVRAKALERLERLRNRDTTTQLVALYERVTEREEKLEIVRCFIASEDPRAFPLFTRVLDHEEDRLVRSYVAVGLAQWNVRCGVGELVGVLDNCKDDEQRDRAVCDEAAKSFSWLNLHKGWGLPEDRIREEILSRTDVSNEEMSAIFVSEIKKWWAENEHRFPEWKPGDPLPEIPDTDRNASDGQ